MSKRRTQQLNDNYEGYSGITVEELLRLSKDELGWIAIGSYEYKDYQIFVFLTTRDGQAHVAVDSEGYVVPFGVKFTPKDPNRLKDSLINFPGSDITI